MEKILNWGLAGLVIIAAAVITAVLGGIPLMLVWNAVIPEVFSIRQINLIQAIGLIFICSVLFKSFSTK